MSNSHVALTGSHINWLAHYGRGEQLFIGCTQCAQWVLRLDAESNSRTGARPVGWVRRCEHFEDHAEAVAHYLTPLETGELVAHLVADGLLFVAPQGVLFEDG